MNRARHKSPLRRPRHAPPPPTAGGRPKKIAYFPLLLGMVAGALLLLLGARMVQHEEAVVRGDLTRLAKDVARDLPPRVLALLEEDAAYFAEEEDARGAGAVTRKSEGRGAEASHVSSCLVSAKVRFSEPAPEPVAPLPPDASALHDEETCKRLSDELPTSHGDARTASVTSLVRSCPLARGSLGTLLVPALLAETKSDTELRTWLTHHRETLTSADRRYLHTVLADAPFDSTTRRDLASLLRHEGGKASDQALSDRSLAVLARASLHEPASKLGRTLRADTTIARTLPAGQAKRDSLAVLDPDELVRCAEKRVPLSSDLALRIADAQERDRETTVRLAPELRLEVMPRGPDVLRVRTRTTKLLFGSLFALAIGLGASLTAFLAWKGRRAEELAELRTDFAAAIAHELRTPLTSMRILAELLAEGSLSPEDHRVAAKNLLTQTARLSTSAERMLTLRSLMLEKRVPELHPVSLGALVETATREFSERVPGAPIHRDLQTNAEGETDPALLRLIIDNLMENASKYAGGPKEVYVREAGREWELGVVDEGPGVPDALKRKLFEPFERAEARLSDTKKGAGLGLALVRYAADAIGARVGILDASPKGAIFYVRVPRAEPEETTEFEGEP